MSFSMDQGGSLPTVFSGGQFLKDLEVGAMDMNDESADMDVTQAEVLDSDMDFGANLALDMDDQRLKKLAVDLSEEIESDIAARSEWENSIKTVLRYMGWKVEEFRKEPFINACGVYDTTLSSALIGGVATALAELFPPAGPINSQITGIATQEIEDKSERCQLYGNHYLTVVDEPYYPDSNQMIWYAFLFGSVFRKIYIDPITKMPVMRMVKPFDFIVNPDTTNLLEASRLTEVLHFSHRDIHLREAAGDYKEGTFPNEESDDNTPSNIQKMIDKIDGINKDGQEKKTLYKYYECHVYLDASEIEPGKYKPGDDDEIERPYIVTFCEDNKKIAAIRRGWKEGDNTYKREKYFVNYYLLKGFGIYGLGYAHMLGSNAIALTSILRQTIDAGMLKNFPGGLKVRGTKAENNDRAIGPGEFIDIDTGGLPIQDAIMLMPYGEPSQALMALRTELIGQSMGIINAAENTVPENNNNAPVGTTLAVLEVAHRNQSMILSSLHNSLGCELKLFYKLLGQCLPDQPYPFPVPGRQAAVMRADFDDRISFVPVSNPNVLTSAHRLVKDEALLKLVMSAPQLYDMRNAHERMLQSMKIENIEKILLPLPQPVSLDPISENMALLSGQKIMAMLGQDHDAHIIIKTKFAKEMQMVNPAIYAEVMMNIQQHKALHLVESEPQLMQMIQMNPQQANAQQILMIPQVQNFIAKMDAEMQQEQEKEMMEAMQNQPKPMDPTVVMMAEVEQKREAARMKQEDSALKAETEAFKAQLKYEGDKEKTQSQREIAEAKLEVDLAKAHMKPQTMRSDIL